MLGNQIEVLLTSGHAQQALALAHILGTPMDTSNRQS